MSARVLQGLGLFAQTNNPRKIRVLEELGVVVTARIPCIVKAQEFNMGYLATKQVRQLVVPGCFQPPILEVPCAPVCPQVRVYVTQACCHSQAATEQCMCRGCIH